MKLIDEKIKALGLTKGEYCKKYGFKFKDFAAKVHTLEAKLEWANSFLKPLGLDVGISPMSTEQQRDLREKVLVELTSFACIEEKARSLYDIDSLL